VGQRTEKGFMIPASHGNQNYWPYQKYLESINYLNTKLNMLSMAESYGYIIIFDEPLISERLKELDEFSDGFSIPDWKMKSSQICLLSFDRKTITRAAIGYKGKRATTFKSEIYFKHILDFPPVSIKKILEKMGSRTRNYFIKSSTGTGGSIPARTWEDLGNVIKYLNSDAYKAIKSLQEIIEKVGEFKTIPEYEIVAYEKDAVGLLLDIFGEKMSLRKRILPYWRHSGDEKNIAPFLKGIGRSKLAEDTIINNDSKIFGDWEFMRSLPNLSSTDFFKNGETLTICNTNRTTIEKTLGVDLIYYHHTYNSFVLIQYKRMTQEGVENKYIYRPKNDKNYKKEITSCSFQVFDFAHKIGYQSRYHVIKLFNININQIPS
jgi:hypothetical protein